MNIGLIVLFSMIVFLGGIYALLALPDPPSLPKISRFIILLSVVGFFSLLLAARGYYLQNEVEPDTVYCPFFFDNFAKDFYIIYFDEIVGGVLIGFAIEYFTYRQNRVLRKRELFDRLESQDNKTTLSAIPRLRDEGWLYDGSLSKVDFRNAELSNAKLREANLENANLIGSNLIGANLTDANLRKANLQKVKLEGIKLKGADLRLANLKYVNFNGVNLEETKLEGTNLKGAYLRKSSLERATYNQYTTWPRTFDPIEAGAIKID